MEKRVTALPNRHQGAIRASQKIIVGKIKPKNEGPTSIAIFTLTSLLFKDGSTLNADVILFGMVKWTPRATPNYAVTEMLVIPTLDSSWRTFVTPSRLCGLSINRASHARCGAKLAGLWSILGNVENSKHIAKHGGFLC